jgi:hypothetical protein
MKVLLDMNLAPRWVLFLRDVDLTRRIGSK